MRLYCEKGRISESVMLLYVRNDKVLLNSEADDWLVVSPYYVIFLSDRHLPPLCEQAYKQIV